jgi:hypothetical protein
MCFTTDIDQFCRFGQHSGPPKKVFRGGGICKSHLHTESPVLLLFSSCVKNETQNEKPPNGLPFDRHIHKTSLCSICVLENFFCFYTAQSNEKNYGALYFFDHTESAKTQVFFESWWDRYQR